MLMRTNISTLFAIMISAVIVAHAQSPASVEKSLIQQLDQLSKYGNYLGTPDEDKRDAANKRIEQLLIRNGKRLAILKYSFPALQKKMSIATSKDGRLRIYSWDSEMGGTMHDYYSVYQYQGKSGKVHTWQEVRGENYGVGAFYHDIFEVKTNKGRIYLPVSTFIGSTSLNGQSISAVKIVGERLVPRVKIFRTTKGLSEGISFEDDFFTVVDRPERPIKLFSFHEKKKEFRFPVVIADDKDTQGRVTDKFITYRFNGKYFVKVS